MNFNDVVTKAKTLQTEINGLKTQVLVKESELSALTKEHFGLVDGKGMSVLEIAEAIKRISKLD